MNVEMEASELRKSIVCVTARGESPVGEAWQAVHDEWKRRHEGGNTEPLLPYEVACVLSPSHPVQ